jgi:uncharacterized protein YjbI with pentapeptide repeats
MANPEHLAILKQGVEVWNTWRKGNSIGVDLSEANLYQAELGGADLSEVNLTRGFLCGANLEETDFEYADLTKADFSAYYVEGIEIFGMPKGMSLSPANLRSAILGGANLHDANLCDVNLREANLVQADLTNANLSGADLAGADLDGAVLGGTLFANSNLKDARNLDYCNHRRESALDYATIKQSGGLPISFLRGCGLPENTPQPAYSILLMFY